MKSLKKNCMKVFGEWCSRRRHMHEDGLGSYEMLVSSSSWSDIDDHDETTTTSNNNRGVVIKKEKKKRKQVSKDKKISIPNGYFCVYVGAERQRFVIKIEVANHRYFKMLLEETENEYDSPHHDGPIWLPCNVNVFCKVLAEIEHSLAFRNRFFPYFH